MNTQSDLINNKDMAIRAISRVLIVEDDEISYKFLEELLSLYDMEILHADNGHEAYKVFKEESNISLVLLDIRLPGINGFKLASLFKQLEPNVPIIAQTAYGMTGDKQKCLNAGCDDYIKKPINIDLFYQLIETYLVLEKISEF